MKDITSYLVTSYDETRGAGVGASSLIPTIGVAATAIDQYRTAGIQSTNLPELGAAFTDVMAMDALAKIAEGGLTSVQELEAAEIALQAFLLHEVVHVVTHAPKVDYGAGLISYRRLDEGARSRFAFDLMSITEGRDFLIAPEFVRTDGGVIVSTTFEDSPLLGKRLDSLTPGFKYWNLTIADAVNAAIAQHNIPVYLSDPLLIRSHGRDWFAKNFYHRLRISWNKVTEGIPAIEFAFDVPPFLAIVLDRLNNRQDLKSVLIELREELKNVRTELRDLNSEVTKATTQQEIFRRVKHINESFDAIVAESSLANVERRQRRVKLIQRISRPIVKFMAGFVMKTGPTVDDLLTIAPAANMIIEDRSIVDRTVTARTFSKLIKVEAVQSLVKHHLTATEIAAIEASANR